MTGWMDATMNRQTYKRGSIVIVTERKTTATSNERSEVITEPFLPSFLSWGQNYSAFVKHLSSKKKRLPPFFLPFVRLLLLPNSRLPPSPF